MDPQQVTGEGAARETKVRGRAGQGGAGPSYLGTAARRRCRVGGRLGSRRPPAPKAHLPYQMLLGQLRKAAMVQQQEHAEPSQSSPAHLRLRCAAAKMPALSWTCMHRLLNHSCLAQL